MGMVLLLSGIMNPYLNARISYRTDLLERMASVMQLTSRLDTLRNGMYTHQIFYKGKPLTVIVRDNRIEHIGYALFTSYQRSCERFPVYNFLERYFLEIDLPLKREKTVTRKIAEDNVSLEKGTFSFFQTLWQDTTYNIRIENRNGERYIVSWHKEDTVYCSINFPIDFDLLNGSGMLENEMRIEADLLNASLVKVNPVRVNRDELLPAWQSNYFILPGESYYTDELNTNRYYELDTEGSFRLVYNPKYPLESLANLLTSSEIDNQFVVDIHLKKYGYREKRMSIPLNCWTGYCMKNGCKPFFGVIEYDGNRAVCELIMRNADLGYNHVMKIVFDVSRLESKKGSFEARLNCYVPCSKIKYLFDEIRQ